MLPTHTLVDLREDNNARELGMGIACYRRVEEKYACENPVSVQMAPTNSQLKCNAYHLESE